MNSVSDAEVFVFRADLSDFADCPTVRRKKAVSEIARNFVTARASEFTGLSVSEIQYLNNQHGKPYIAGNPIYFNVSHCGSVIAAAFCTEEIGVDIEFVREYSEAVVRRYFTDDEKAYMNGMVDIEQCRERFFEIWTAKEAFLKLYGVGISGGFDFSAAVCGGLLENLYSEKFGSAQIIHHSGNMKIFPDDIFIKNISENNDGFVKYCLSLCGKEIKNVSWHCENL